MALSANTEIMVFTHGISYTQLSRQIKTVDQEKEAPCSVGNSLVFHCNRARRGPDLHGVTG